MLAFLAAATQQNHKPFAVLAKINAIARPEIDTAFKNSRTDALDVREIPRRQAGQSRCHFRRRLGIQVIEPGGDGLWLSAALYSRTSIMMVAYELLSGKSQMARRSKSGCPCHRWSPGPYRSALSLANCRYAHSACEKIATTTMRPRVRGSLVIVSAPAADPETSKTTSAPAVFVSSVTFCTRSVSSGLRASKPNSRATSSRNELLSARRVNCLAVRDHLFVCNFSSNSTVLSFRGPFAPVTAVKIPFARSCGVLPNRSITSSFAPRSARSCTAASFPVLAA